MLATVFLKKALLQEKLEEEKIRMQQMFERNTKDQHDQLTNFLLANFKEQKQARMAALVLQKTLEFAFPVLRDFIEDLYQEKGSSNTQPEDG